MQRRKNQVRPLLGCMTPNYHLKAETICTDLGQPTNIPVLYVEVGNL
jgi:hypothetical protein